jgi:hypothetical protein
MIAIPMTKVTLLCDTALVTEDAELVRGFFGQRHADDDRFHNHGVGLSTLSRYPMVQYRVLDGQIMILAVGSAGQALMRAMEKIETLTLTPLDGEPRECRVTSSSIEESIGVVELLDEPVVYRFMTPWWPMNPKRYAEYRDCNSRHGRVLLLNRLLRRQIMIMACDLAPAGDQAEIEGWEGKMESGISLRRTPISFSRVFDGRNEDSKSKRHFVMEGFSGKFEINVRLPPLIAVGKGVSRGFGVVMPSEGMITNTVF